MTILLRVRDRGAHLDHCRSRAPPVVSHDSDLLLLLSAEAQFRRSEQTVGNQDISIDAIVDEFGFAVLADDEQRRHFALPDPGREFDIDLSAVVIRIDWPPRRVVALDDVAVAALA